MESKEIEREREIDEERKDMAFSLYGRQRVVWLLIGWNAMKMSRAVLGHIDLDYGLMLFNIFHINMEPYNICTIFTASKYSQVGEYLSLTTLLPHTFCIYSRLDIYCFNVMWPDSITFGRISYLFL